MDVKVGACRSKTREIWGVRETKKKFLMPWNALKSETGLECTYFEDIVANCALRYILAALRMGSASGRKKVMVDCGLDFPKYVSVSLKDV